MSGYGKNFEHFDRAMNYGDMIDHETDSVFQADLWSRVRSDLLLESAELLGEGIYAEALNGKGMKREETQGEHLKDDGLPVMEYERNGILITEIRIENDEQAERLKRPKGRYVTLYSDSLREDDGGIHQEAVDEIAGWIRKLLPARAKSVLVAGLGNPEASPDALGPDTIGHVAVNRHLENRFRQSDIQVCAMAPGVMAQTGLETAGILAGVTDRFTPDALIVIDALAARSVTRLGTTIQITDTGISPGSGIGNYRQEISRDVLGVPVIAIGIPMVVEAAAIIYETIDAIRSVYRQEKMEEEAAFLNQLSRQEQYNLFRELLEKKARPLYVTVKDVDEMEKRLSFTLSEAINQALSGMNPGSQA